MSNFRSFLQPIKYMHVLHSMRGSRKFCQGGGGGGGPSILERGSIESYSHLWFSRRSAHAFLAECFVADSLKCRYSTCGCTSNVGMAPLHCTASLPHVWHIWGVQPGFTWVPYRLSHMRFAQMGPICVPHNSPLVNLRGQWSSLPLHAAAIVCAL